MRKNCIILAEAKGWVILWQIDWGDFSTRFEVTDRIYAETTREFGSLREASAYFESRIK